MLSSLHTKIDGGIQVPRQPQTSLPSLVVWSSMNAFFLPYSTFEIRGVRPPSVVAVMATATVSVAFEVLALASLVASDIPSLAAELSTE